MTSTQSSPLRPPKNTRTLPPELDAVAEVLDRHAQNPSAFLALNEGTEHFSVPGAEGVVAYRIAGRSTIVQLGGVFGASKDQPLLLGAFLDFARVQRRRVVAVQLMRPDAELYATYGFTVNQLGADYARELAGFNLAGKKHMQLRNKLSRARRAGVSVAEVAVSDPELPCQLDAVDKAWLRSKGRHVKELQFMVGQRAGAAQPLRRLFVARDESGSILGYISFSPVYGTRSGWLHDLSRRHPDAPPGILELIVVTAVETFRAEGAAYLHFGFTPFTGLSAEHEVSGSSAVVGRIVRLLADHGSAIYPAADQLAYKEKWALNLVEPEYVAFQRGVSAGAVWNLLRLTNAA